MRKTTALSAILITCTLLPGCSRTKPAEDSIRMAKADTVRIYAYGETSTFPGKVRPASEADLSFRISGPISGIHVNEGSYVRKGEVLAEIDPRDYAVQLAATEAEYRRIKAEAERIFELHEKGSVAPNDYDKAVYGLQQITAKYEAHRNALADTRLLAPFDGCVNKRLRETGETVSAGMPVLSVISIQPGEIEINIPSSDYIRSDRFESYYCTANLYPGKEFPLELVGMTPKANLNQLYTMRLRLVGKESGDLSPGMSVMVSIKYRPEYDGFVSIHLSSVFQADGQSKVWVYDTASGTVSARAVKLSQILSDGTAGVSEGLQAGEIVISAGVCWFREGEKVKLLPQTSVTNVGGML